MAKHSTMKLYENVIKALFVSSRFAGRGIIRNAFAPRDGGHLLRSFSSYCVSSWDLLVGLIKLKRLKLKWKKKTGRTKRSARW